MVHQRHDVHGHELDGVDALLRHRPSATARVVKNQVQGIRQRHLRGLPDLTRIGGGGYEDQGLAWSVGLVIEVDAGGQLHVGHGFSPPWGAGLQVLPSPCPLITWIHDFPLTACPRRLDRYTSNWTYALFTRSRRTDGGASAVGPRAFRGRHNIMGKALIIAEKPSVAADVARALGGFKRHQDYYESDDYVLSSAVGHLLEQTPPEGVEAKRGKWSFANLPVIPPYFDLKPIQKSASRLKTLVKLIKRKDVGRPGQRLRRRTGGRAHLPEHHPPRQGQEAHQAAVAPVHDPRRHPQRLRGAARGRRDAAPGGCRPEPLRGRLARWASTAPGP